MLRYSPRTLLETHEVTNQPSEFGGRNLYTTDAALRAAVRREAGDWLDQRLVALGEAVGSEETLDLGEAANRYPPELVSFDRYGRRVDEVRFHPSYHRLMSLAMEHGIHDIAWAEQRPGRHLGHLAMLALFTQAEAGVMCPINMTYASVAALQMHPDVTKPWLDKLVGGTYDPDLKPIEFKTGITIGMAMTEKQGGSDVRANSTRAQPIEGGGNRYRLVGHKWFCSAPMSDGFLTLAHTEQGLSCFLVPRIVDGERNAVHVMRLKDKMGNKSNASSEIEYHGAVGFLLGEEGRGVKVIIDMVHHTRLGCMAGTLGIMRMALAQAMHHASGRRVFQKTLIDQPLMRQTLADLSIEYEAAVVLCCRVARAFDGDDEQKRAFARLGVALGKYWLTKRNPNFVFECMETHGGVGYVEETPMPRLFRESPLNAIWEGSGNVIVLDVLRTLQKEPGAINAYLAEVSQAQGLDASFDKALNVVTDALGRTMTEANGRLLVERMTLLLQGALLLLHASKAVARAFCATRLGADWGHMFGTLPADTDIDAILERN
jgi:putative acyl-CoA dehydrogenase